MKRDLKSSSNILRHQQIVVDMDYLPKVKNQTGRWARMNLSGRAPAQHA
jgi:hypothetical protein